MCLGVPGKVVHWIEREGVLALAEVEFAGIRRACHMACVTEAQIGDYVIVHAGVAISRIDAAEAQRIFDDLARLNDETWQAGDSADEEGSFEAAMKYVDEYRDAAAARKLLAEIRARATRRWTLMDVCGGQTHSLLRHGIEAELDGTLELIHGPGCPVCVTPLEAIDLAQDLATRSGIVLSSFGDMLRVPGSRRSLLDVQAAGGRVRAVYSPLDAVELARRNPEDQVVFFAVGFETTAPATALAVLQADRDGLKNFSLLVAHVCVLPAMEAIARMPDNRVQAFLAAGHVCTVTGYESYNPFVAEHKLPVVVTGFEPLDLLEGILACVEQREAGEARVENRYARSVRRQGNLAAQDVVRQVYEVCDRPWRGFGVIARGGLQLRTEWREFDALKRFVSTPLPVMECDTCRSADVLSGRIRPMQCESFGTRCTPESPLGAPMVSSEGACAAYYRYRATEVESGVPNSKWGVGNEI